MENSGKLPQPDRSTAVKAFSMMASMSGRLNLPPSVKMQAWKLYKKSELLLSKNGYQNLAPTVAVSLYLACLSAGKPRTLKDILSTQFRNPSGNHLQVETGSLVEFLAQSFDMELMGTSYDKRADDMRRFCVLLGMGKGGFHAALKALRKAEAACMAARTRRLRSHVMEAVSIFMAAQSLKPGKAALLDVAIITGVSEDAIVNAHEEICSVLKNEEHKTSVQPSALQTESIFLSCAPSTHDVT